MKFCVIVGSSRADGQSAQVCRLIRNHLGDRGVCDFVYLREHRIELCDADNACVAEPCAVNDSVQGLVQRMLDADALVYVPVVHAYGTNSRFQAFLERAGYGFLRPMGRPLRDKLAGIVVVGRRYGHTSIYSQTVLNILLNKMIMVGAGFPATFVGGAGDEEASQAMCDMLDRMVEIGTRLMGSESAHAKQREALALDIACL